MEQDHVPTVHEKTHIWNPWWREGLRCIIQNGRQDGSWHQRAEQRYHDLHHERDGIRRGIDPEPLCRPQGHNEVQDFLDHFQGSDPARQVDPVQHSVLWPPLDEVHEGMSYQDHSHDATIDDQSLGAHVWRCCESFWPVPRLPGQNIHRQSQSVHGSSLEESHTLTGGLRGKGAASR